MPRPRDPDLEEAISLVNLEAFLHEHGMKFRVSGDEISLEICPRCRKAWKLYINRRTKRFICFSLLCNNSFQGHFPLFVQQVENVDYSTAKKHIQQYAERRGWARRETSLVDLIPLDQDVALPPNFRQLGDPGNPFERPYWLYLRNRGVSDLLIREYHMGYTRLGPYAGRVFIPVLFQGRLANWIARDITGKLVPKIQTPPGNHQGSVLFNYDRLRYTTTLVLTEGVFDALRLPDRCVATFGKRLTTEQRNILIRSNVKELIFAWDNDAWSAITKTAWEVRPFFDSVRITRLPPGQDPSSLTETAFCLALDNAEPITDWHRLDARLGAVRKL